MDFSAKTTTPTVTWPIFWMVLENPRNSTNAQPNRPFLSKNIDRAMRENQPPNYQTNRHQIFSYFLKNVEDTTKITIEKTKFELNSNLMANFCVQDLFLLRDWPGIPGWDESPLYKDVRYSGMY
jgi:hypothetical protein